MLVDHQIPAEEERQVQDTLAGSPTSDMAAVQVDRLVDKLVGRQDHWVDTQDRHRKEDNSLRREKDEKDEKALTQ